MTLIEWVISMICCYIIYKAYSWADKYYNYRLMNSEWNGKKWVYKRNKNT